ncbi:MAG: hypothetical protein K0R67_613 [Paenibacillus sp.]|jgi:uncharacterized protein|nr:hypothetical protein [Paenibacillus sp.]
MILNVRDLRAKNNRMEFKEQIELPSLTSGRRDIVRAKPLQVTLQAVAVEEFVEVAGTLELQVELVCSRCLTPYNHSLELPFREMFVQDAEQVDEDDEHMHLVVHERVDLLPYIEETVELGLPYIPLCKENCKGLDSETGLNLNEHPAPPVADRIDPRLEVLAQFFEKQKKQ